MALTADGKLPQQPSRGLGPPAKTGVGDHLLELHVQHPGMLVVGDRADVACERVGHGLSEVVRKVLVNLSQKYLDPHNEWTTLLVHY